MAILDMSHGICVHINIISSRHFHIVRVQKQFVLATDSFSTLPLQYDQSILVYITIADMIRKFEHADIPNII